MTGPPRPTPDPLTLAPELGLLAALEAVLDLTVRALEAAWPEPRGNGDEEYLASRITLLAGELCQALLDYRDVLVDDGS